MIEIHPFKPFIPKNSKYLILGSFVGKNVGLNKYNWYYSSPRNQFWMIIENVYNTKLNSKSDKAKLFQKLKIAITDIILKCERLNNSNLDINLKKISFNLKGINLILSKNKIKTIYFTSRFVEKYFNSKFRHIIIKYPNIKLITLPSPSPRNAKYRLGDKIIIYKKLLPNLQV